MKRRFKWMLWVGVSFLALVAAVSLLAGAFLPGVVRYTIIHTLEDAGMPGVTLEVSRINHRRIEIKNLSLGEGAGLDVESIEAYYTVSSLAEGRIQSVTVSGVTVELSVKNGVVDLGAFAGLAGGGGSWADMPFKRAELNSFVLAIDLGDETVEISLDAAAEFRGEDTALSLRLDLFDMSVRNEKAGVEIDGVNSSIIIDSFEPLATEPGLRLGIKKLQFGEFETENLEAIFRITDNDKLDVQIVKTDWAGGKLIGRNIRARVSGQEFDFDIQCEGLSLQKVMDFIVPGRVECEGWLYGHLPISIRMGRRKPLSFGEGYLEARPPRGWIKLMEDDAKWLLGIEKVVSLEEATEDEVVKMLALQALQDMEYTKLSVVFKNEEETGWTVHSKLSGESRGGGIVIPIGEIAKNITGLDDMLNLLVKGIRLGDFTKTEEERKEEDSLNEAIEAFF